MRTEQIIEEGYAAYRAGRWPEAQAAFEGALADEESPEALVGLADTLRWIGETRRSIVCRERAYTLLRERDDALGAATQCVELSFDYDMSLGNRVAGQGWLARAARLSAEAAAEPVLGWLWLCQSGHAPTPSESIDLIERALAFAREQGDRDLEWCALSSLGVALAAGGDIEGGLRCVDEAMAASLGGDLNDVGVVIFISCQMLTACDMVSDLERARMWCKAADEFVQKYGAPYLYAKCHTMYGRVLVAIGRWSEAERELAKVITSTRDEFPAVHALAIGGLADLWTRQGRLDEAEGLLDEVNDPLLIAVVEARLHLKRGRQQAAASVIERWLASEVSVSDHHAAAEVIPALALLVDAHVAGTDLQAAQAAFERLEEAASAHDETSVARAYLASARGRLAAESPESARTCFEEAVARFGRLELPYDTACARLDLAHALAVDRREAAIVEARGALAAFDRLGASRDADVAAALLRSWGVSGRTGSRDVGVLSQREQEVLALIGAGLSNPEIAERLVISRKTAAHHVSNVLSKLGLRNRAEAAAYAARMAEPAQSE